MSASCFRFGAKPILKGLGTGEIRADFLCVTPNPHAASALPISSAKSSASVVPMLDQIPSVGPFVTWIMKHNFLAWSPLTRRGATFASSSRSAACSWLTLDCNKRLFFLNSSAFPLTMATKELVASLISVSTLPASMCIKNSPATPIATSPAPRSANPNSQLLGLSGVCITPRRKSRNSWRYSTRITTSSMETPTTTSKIQNLAKNRATTKTMPAYLIHSLGPIRR